MNSELGKYMMLIGVIILLAGLVVYFLYGHLKWIGRLPGDIRVERENFRFYFPLTTLILLNGVVFLIIRLWKWLNP